MILSQALLASVGVGIEEFLEDWGNTWTKSALEFYPVKIATAPTGTGRLCKCFCFRYMICPVSKVLHNRTDTSTGQSKGSLRICSFTLNHLTQRKCLYQCLTQLSSSRYAPYLTTCSNGGTHNKNEQNFRWLAGLLGIGYLGYLSWTKFILTPYLGLHPLNSPLCMHSFQRDSRHTSKIWDGICKLEEVSFACGCELAAIDRGQQSHVLSKITPSYRLKHGPARQGQK